ncbi:MAG: response regulator [Candidatus Ozemobacteraceae bacterium]
MSTQEKIAPVPTICIVNDDLILLKLLNCFLEKENFRILTFTSVDEALRTMMIYQPPDLIVSDLHMPSIDGWKFCRLLRSPEFYPLNAVPILVVSATYTGDDVPGMCLDQGANGFLPLPVDPKRLVATVNQLLQGGTAFRKPRVLIIDDSPWLNSFLVKSFSDKGYEACGALNASDGESRFRELLPDLTILDFHLPDAPGSELLEKFSTHYPRGLIIMITADANPHLALDWMKKGAAAYVRKPFEIEYLFSLVEKAERERILLHVEQQLELRTREWKKSEETYRHLFETMNQGVVYQDAQGQIISVNPAAVEILGLSQEEITGRTSFDPRWKCIHEDGSEFSGDDHPTTIALRTGTPVHNVLMGIFNPELKMHRWVLVSAVPEYRPGGKHPFRVFASFTDVTERQFAIAAHEESEGRFYSLFQNMTEGVALHEIVRDEAGNAVDYKILDVNPAFEWQTSIPTDNIRGKLSRDVYGTPFPPYLEIYELTATTGVPYSFETYFEALSRHFRISVISPKRNIFGTIFEDITSKKNAEEAEIRSNALLRAVIDQSPFGVIICEGNSRAWRVTIVNKASASILDMTEDDQLSLGFENEAFINRERISFRVFQASGEPLLLEETPLFKVMNLGIKAVNQELLLISHAGKSRTLLWNAVPIHDKQGHLLAGIVVISDISERKQIEEEIIRLNEALEKRVSDRTAELSAANEELEAFAYSVSHDLRAPLRSLDGFSHVLVEDYGNRLDEQGKDYLQRIRLASQRMGRLIDDLLRLSRITRSEMRHVVVDLSSLSHSIVQDLAAADSDYSVQVNIEKNLVVKADASLMRVVLENLLGNSWKFCRRTPNPRITVGCHSKPEGRVFYVSDNGAGFDMAFAGKLFTPFQRLHSTEEFDGTGIGLATAARIIQRHGGRIWCESESGKGATFFFILRV